MTAQTSIYHRMAIARLQELAATEGEHQDEAARAYVDRLADMELERRLVMRHNRPGWHPSSPGFGDGTGKSTVRADPLAEEYDRGNIVDSYWHNRAERAFNALPVRQCAALMLQTAKTDPQTTGPFAASYDQIAHSIGHFLQSLGWAPGGPAGHTFDCVDDGGSVRKRTAHHVPSFKNGQAIKWAAREGRVALLMQAKVGVV